MSRSSSTRPLSPRMTHGADWRWRRGRAARLAPGPRRARGQPPVRAGAGPIVWVRRPGCAVVGPLRDPQSVHHWCRQWRTAQHEVADVTHEVFAAVAASLDQFRPDQSGTTFRGWMRGITRQKLLHDASSRGEPAICGTDAQFQLQQVPAPAREADLSESPADVTGCTSGPCAWSSTRLRAGP
jgi:hypothetical protein